MVAPQSGSFFQYITAEYGYEFTSRCKLWISTNEKICKSRQQLTFLIRCRQHDVFPPHIENARFNISFRSNTVICRFDILKKRYKRMMLSLEIKDINYNLKFLRLKLKKTETELITNLPHDLITNFFQFGKEKVSRLNHSIKISLINKFNNILNKQNIYYNSFFNADKSKWLINVSNKIIPDSTSLFLSLGEKFGLPIDQHNKRDRISTVLETIKNFEIRTNKIHPNLVEETRSKIANSLHKFLQKDKHTCFIDRYLLKEQKKCKKFLQENDDLFVTRADKSQTTVVMNKNDYINGMFAILNDESTYRKIKKDPIKQISTKVNQVLRCWFDGDSIDIQTYRRLQCTNGNLPRCYGLPKIHKSGFPLRIIVSSLGSTLYNIAAFLHDILHQSIKKPKSYIKDSWSFVKTIKDKKIYNNELLISLDVTSLFTNIPKELVLKGIEDRWQDISSYTTLTLQQFLYAIELILNSTVFSFNGKFYEQIFGSPMGSPLSPILADIVMDDLETRCLNTLDFKISFYCRYVDDIFAIVPSDKVDAILLKFNSFHPRLKFTFETEVNGAINFLDTTVFRNNDGLITNWHRKSTFSGRYINYFSSHPRKYKLNIITGLVDRAILLSDKRFHHSNVNIIREILANNSFPLHLINKHVKKRLREIRYNTGIPSASVLNNDSDNDTHNFITIPYVHGLSDRIFFSLKKCGFDVAYTIPKKLDNVIKKGKDIINLNRRTEVVYKINCNNCDRYYIGQTKRHLETRVKEHINDIKKGDSNHSVVSKHRLVNNHDFVWHTPQILHTEKHTRKREIAEMFYIKKYTNNINLMRDTENLNPIYNRLIDVT